ncbi:acetyltransferase [Companilactobacillus farciminis]|nr:acetyltransferase [Companilactobacillus farciminis]
MTCQSELFNVDERLVEQNQRLLQHLNTSRVCSQESNQLLSEILGYQLDSTDEIRLPFHTDYGRNIKFGKNIFINCDVTMVDIGKIIIEDYVIIGPNTTLLTTNYQTKNKAPIVIKQKANIGANVTIMPGVTIGKEAVVLAGSVVTKNVLANTVVMGNPAQEVKKGEVFNE